MLQMEVTMKVYLVLDCNWQDYSGGGAEVVSVHASEDLAVAKVKAILKERGVKPGALKPNARNEWGFVSGGGADYWLEIQPHEVEDFVE